MSAADGVFSPLSLTSNGDLARNGTSHTIMFGEKYLDPLHATDGQDPATLAELYAGFSSEDRALGWKPGGLGQLKHAFIEWLQHLRCAVTSASRSSRRG